MWERRVGSCPKGTLRIGGKQLPSFGQTKEEGKGRKEKNIAGKKAPSSGGMKNWNVDSQIN